MTYRHTARTTRRVRTRRIRTAGLIVALAVAAALLAGRLPSSSPTTASSSPIDLPRITADLAVRDAPRGEAGGAVPGEPLGMADGALPDGATVFDDGIPAVANLDADLLGALRQAADDAGIAFLVEGGWRSPEYQARLLSDAVAEHGSEAEAARWVATPETSAHVSGDAVDIAPAQAAAWLAEHGAAYGLCRVYDNEPWHFELRPGAAGRGCPPTYADPTHDPRTQG